MNYVAYDPATGAITSSGSIPGTLEDALALGNTMLEGVASAETHYVDVSTKTLVPCATRPSPHHNFDYTTKQWVDPRTLADLKLTKTQEINAARLGANRSSFTFAGKQIACDELSRSDIDGFNGIVSLTGALPPDWIGYWKAADNTLIAIPDVATWTGLYGAMVAQGQANFAHSQDLKAALAAATTAAEVEGIVW